jgi:predicted ATP-dependent endonuclease of OLD family
VEKLEKFHTIKRNISELLGMDVVVEIPATTDHLILNIHGKRLPLNYFGAGIHECIMLICALIIYDNQLVLFEEPELHLHPELQKKLFQFLLKTNNTYFISTHSSAFIDIANSNVSIYHVTNDSQKTSVEYCDSSEKTRAVLDDLGYKNSDLLQTNGIIWVEGPSDRNYINRWLSLLSQHLQEGLHYSIMFYAGKNLANVCFDDEWLETHLIPLLRINRNAFVVIDSDKKNQNTDISATKKRIEQEIGGDRCWITEVNEFENYLYSECLYKWLSTKEISNPVSIGKFTNIHDELISKDSKLKYNANKTKYSKDISEHIESKDLVIFDLKEHIDRIATYIIKWNKLDA